MLKYKYYIESFCIVLLAVALLHFLQWDQGLSFWDEGYLWYGVQQAMQGAVPGRDFMAYDPGRYYTYAALMSSYGDGSIASFRLAGAIVQFFVLFLSLILVTFSSEKRVSLIFRTFFVCIMAVFMYARQRYIDIGVSVVLIAAFTYAFTKNHVRSFVGAGFLIGLAAFFGRNHGLYGGLAFILAVFYMHYVKPESVTLPKKIGATAFGVILGGCGYIFMFFMHPGFFQSFLDSLNFLLEVKTTNITLPVPWPWLVDFERMFEIQVLRQMSVGLLFVFFIVFVLFGWFFLLKNRKANVDPIFVASVSLSTFYIHYAFSRADVDHLTTSYFPVLLGLTVWLLKSDVHAKNLCAFFFLLFSSFTFAIYHPAWYCHNNSECKKVQVTGSSLLLDGTTANDVLLLNKLVDKYTDSNSNLLATPFWPGAYAVIGRKSPIWEIYALFPRSEHFQRLEIERIKAANVSVVFILDVPIDGRADLRYKHTHPLIYEYIVSNYTKVNESDISYYQIYKIK